MSEKHTAPPWRVVPPGDIVKATRIAAVEGGDFAYIPLSSPWIEGAWDGDEIADANAALIVRAVNSHEALVEALKLARGYVIEAAADSNPALDALTTIDAALAECAKPLSEVA